MITQRRSFLFGLGASLLAAPSIIRVATNLMPVSVAHTQAQARLLGPVPMMAYGPDAPVVYEALGFDYDAFRRIIEPGLRAAFNEAFDKLSDEEWLDS